MANNGVQTMSASGAMDFPDGSSWDLSIELTSESGHIRIIVNHDRADRAVTLADIELPTELAEEMADKIQILAWDAE